MVFLETKSKCHVVVCQGPAATASHSCARQASAGCQADAGVSHGPRSFYGRCRNHAGSLFGMLSFVDLQKFQPWLKSDPAQYPFFWGKGSQQRSKLEVHPMGFLCVSVCARNLECRLRGPNLEQRWRAPQGFHVCLEKVYVPKF